MPGKRPGEALVRVRLAGICGTDLELLRGYTPFEGIPGHEFVGEIERAPDDPARVNQRVVGEINVVCHRCSYCLSGSPAHCARRTVLGILGRNGAFAEYLSLPLENLHPVPPEVEDRAAVFTEPLAAALQVLEQIRIEPSSRVLLIGTGRLGLLIAAVLGPTGCDLHAVTRHARQREFLSSQNTTVLAEDMIVERHYDVVIEATGSSSGIEQAIRAVRSRGSIILKSTFKGSASIDVSRIVVDEIRLLGSRCGPFPPALRLLRDRRVDPLPLIENTFTLNQSGQAFERAAQAGALKVLLSC